MALKENRGKKSRRLLSLYGKERYKEILFTDEKNVYCGGNSISKMIEFMHGHPRKPANWYQGSYEVIILVWWGVYYDGITSLHFCEKGVKTVAKNYQQDILSNVVVPLNQTCSKIDYGYSSRALHLRIKPKLDLEINI